MLSSEVLPFGLSRERLKQRCYRLFVALGIPARTSQLAKLLQPRPRDLKHGSRQNRGVAEAVRIHQERSKSFSGAFAIGCRGLWATRRLLLRYQDDLGVNLRVIYGAQANKLDPEARGDMLKYLEQSLKKL